MLVKPKNRYLQNQQQESTYHV